MKKGLTILMCFAFFGLSAQDHPNLILTKEGVASMRANLGKVPLFDKSVANAVREVDEAISKGINVPLPKDLAGGYSHEQHKYNYWMMQKSGVLFQVTQDEKYAVFIRDMLLAYLSLYPSLDRHPQERSYARGKFFWQCLNDANWLVYTSQAYDCIYEWLDKKTKKRLNEKLFRPYAEFLSIETPQFFNRIHNHSTWANAAVGMIGLVMEDDELVEWALRGLDLTVPKNLAKDNDGGAIRIKGQSESGFYAQLDHSFSPDGYYTEGPYYQRYAIYPFLIFAHALSNTRPELEIFEYRDDLLIKAVYALIDQTNTAGEFFPINDSQKGMSLDARELVMAVSLAYHLGGKDPELLSLVKDQGIVPLNEFGMSAALGIVNNKNTSYAKRSVFLRDGARGDEGGIGILRSAQEGKTLTLLLKTAKHGMGHGHFDQLGFALYYNEKEVFQDYGAARWVNIEHKDGGGYLKENKSWAKQTVAHNTLVINQTSQFDADVQKADESSGYLHFFSSDDPNLQVMKAGNKTVYPNVEMTRTMAMISIDELENPIILDLFSVENESESDYDLPFYYQGELMKTNVDVRANNPMLPMGKSYGYQHLWNEATSDNLKENFQMTWFQDSFFMTMTAETDSEDELFFTRIGANDPHFNLRRDPGLLLRRKAKARTRFAQIYEVHGAYRFAEEVPINSFSSIKSLSSYEEGDYTVVSFELKQGDEYLFLLASDEDKTTNHRLALNGQSYSWQGPFTFTTKK